MRADLESCSRCRRAGDEVYLFKSGFEVALDERAHLLRLSVVGIVISCRKCVGAQHDTPRHFRAELLSARFEEHIPERICFCAGTIADPIETRQVSRSLCRSQNVVDIQRICSVRQADLADFRAERRQLFDGFPRRFLDFSLHAVNEVFLWETNAQAS